MTTQEEYEGALFRMIDGENMRDNILNYIASHAIYGMPEDYNMINEAKKITGQPLSYFIPVGSWNDIATGDPVVSLISRSVYVFCRLEKKIMKITKKEINIGVYEYSIAKLER